MKSEKKAKLIERIKSLQGLTDDERGDLLELLRTNKPYGLVWENHKEDVEERLRDELPVLIEDESKRIISDNPDAPNHILIEGDNLEALTTLAYTHAGKIDVIYIDPPYNTGNKDFTYYDDFTDEYRTLPYVDKDDSFRHSKWLSFMSKRLRIAKKLLSDRGVIFISIDDNEQAQLRLLLDDIFRGKSLDRGTLIWENKGSTKGFSKIVKNHEYILAFSNNPDAIKSQYNKNFPADGDLIEERLQIKRSPKNPICQIKFPKGLPIRGIEDIRFDDHVGNGTNRIDIISGDMVFRGGVLQNDIVLEASFPYRNQTEKFFKAMETGEPVYDTKGQQWLEVFFSKTGVPHYSKQRGFTILSSLLDDVPNSGFSDLKALKLETLFNNPKPVALIYKLLSHFSTDNYIILDFFAGSGTTLHATMQLNADDGGDRKCILVTNNENGICEKVTYERNKRVIEGYTKPNNEYVEGLKNNNLRYYRTAFVGRSRSPQNLRKLVRLATDMLCIKEDLFNEQKEFAGQDVVKQAFRYFEKDNNRMLVIYREEAVPLMAPLIEKYNLPDGEKIKVYVFSPSEDPWAGSFEDVADKVELCALPMAILNAYKRVLPKQKDQNIYVEPDMVPDQTEEENKSSDTLFPEEGGDQ